MQQYFVKVWLAHLSLSRRRETSKHMFQVMRLKEDDEVTLVLMMGSSVWRAWSMWRLVSWS